MIFKDRLSLLIKGEGASLNKIAKDIGIAKSSLHNYMLGSSPSLENLVIICDYFDCSLDFLVRGIEQSPDCDLGVEVIEAEIKSKGLYEIIIRKRTRKK